MGCSGCAYGSVAVTEKREPLERTAARATTLSVWSQTY
jgi:hypothetical protein